MNLSRQPQIELAKGNPTLSEAAQLVRMNSDNRSLIIPDSRKDCSEFENPRYRATLEANGVKIQSDQGTNTFAEMQAARRNPIAPGLNESFLVSNIGVSVALTLQIAGKSYAVLAYRGGKPNRHMLISGYVDATESICLSSDPTLATIFFRENALRELAEELIVSNASSQLVIGSISRSALFSDAFSYNNQICWGGNLNLDPHYKAFRGDRASDTFAITPTPLPKFLGNMLGSQNDESITFNGTKLKNVGFQYCKSFNSGQLIFPFEIILPNGGKGLSLFHAEDRLIENNLLKTSLDLDGIVLVELDPSGELTPETFWLRDGELVPRTLHDDKNIKLSEAFDRRNTSSELPRWCVNGDDLMFNARAG